MSKLHGLSSLSDAIIANAQLRTVWWVRCVWEGCSPPVGLVSVERLWQEGFVLHPSWHAAKNKDGMSFCYSIINLFEMLYHCWCNLQGLICHCHKATCMI